MDLAIHPSGRTVWLPIDHITSDLEPLSGFLAPDWADTRSRGGVSDRAGSRPHKGDQSLALRIDDLGREVELLHEVVIDGQVIRCHEHMMQRKAEPGKENRTPPCVCGAFSPSTG